MYKNHNIFFSTGSFWLGIIFRGSSEHKTSTDAFVVSSYAFRRELGRRTGFSKVQNFRKFGKFSNISKSHKVDPKHTKLGSEITLLWFGRLSGCQWCIIWLGELFSAQRVILLQRKSWSAINATKRKNGGIKVRISFIPQVRFEWQ